MSDMTELTTGADGYDQFVDDDIDELLLMNKCTELEAVSTTSGCDQFVVDGRDEILLMHKGTEIKAVSTMKRDLDRSRVHHAGRPHRALQSYMNDILMESGVSEIDIFVASTGNVNIITVDQTKKMKDNAIDGNIGHFDNEIDMDGRESLEGTKVDNTKPQVGHFIFPDGPGAIVSCFFS